MCFRECRLTAVGRYSVDDVPQDPDSWRARCLVSLYQAPSAHHTSFDIKFKLLKVVEEKLLEEARSKLRSKLMKAVEHKKEREVKYTDRVPPPKRARTGCTHFNTPALLSMLNSIPREYKCASKNFISENSVRRFKTSKKHLQRTYIATNANCKKLW